MHARGPEALRAIMGLWGMNKKHSSASLDQACAQALASGTHRLRDIKRLLHVPSQPHLNFQDDHPLVRDLGVYADFITQHTDYGKIP